MPAEKDSASSEGAQEHGQLGVGLFANGILFGLQPDALFVIVPALTLPSQLAAVAYISMFVVGTVAAMGSYTAVIGASPTLVFVMSVHSSRPLEVRLGSATVCILSTRSTWCHCCTANLASNILVAMQVLHRRRFKREIRG